ncbi:endopolygalacturonase C [Pestalotiopsis fici W106-1]|uniref:endo-polygalacturonase n=1 Tax=Pestalotiopsis fici (strain W106-1 / CGMCC3.15140) TaxID=1229662 RepID=W3WM69_PESFW|nr:endopolygalacturonase C [Pestalotiopsis fici W106-1]ETS73906.1 endopolygalacturonase C [Pestalotiopsis fici W106-1]
MKNLVILTLGFAIARAVGEPAPAPTPAPDPRNAVARRADTSCTYSGSAGYSSASESKAACSTIVLSALTVPAGVTLDLEDLNDGTTVVFEGTTTFGYSEWSGPLFSVSGNDITVRGEAGSILDGQGALYWDGQGGSGGVTKPKFFKANNLNDSLLDSITIQNAPKNSFSLNYVYNLTVKDITVDDKAGEELGKNTDAFNINNADGILITGAKVWNQDDCVAINSGKNIVFENGFCSGGHGLSIGSVGGQTNDNAVRNVTFRDSVMENSQQSVRIKTISGANGTVDGITYSNIAMSGGDDYGIIVMQSYNGVDGEPTNGVSVTNFVLQNVTGTVQSDAVNIYIECGVGSCSDWTWTDVHVTGGKNSTDCQNVPEGISC